MRIGVDFDNTLACYDGIFHAVAVERGLIPSTVATDKTSVRDHLRARGQDAVFTELQGYVYGPGMRRVRLYPGAAEGLRSFVAAGHAVYLISHKTRTPFAGEPHDLHAAAWAFLRSQRLLDAPAAPFRECDIHLELTREAKLARIAARGCDLFIDDLPEVLAAPGFPAATRGILFDPENSYPQGHWRGNRFERCTDWHSLQSLITLHRHSRASGDPGEQHQHDTPGSAVVQE